MLSIFYHRYDNVLALESVRKLQADIPGNIAILSCMDQANRAPDRDHVTVQQQMPVAVIDEITGYGERFATMTVRHQNAPGPCHFVALRIAENAVMNMACEIDRCGNPDDPRATLRHLHGKQQGNPATEA